MGLKDQKMGRFNFHHLIVLKMYVSIQKGISSFQTQEITKSESSQVDWCQQFVDQNQQK